MRSGQASEKVDLVYFIREWRGRADTLDNITIKKINLHIKIF